MNQRYFDTVNKRLIEVHPNEKYKNNFWDYHWQQFGAAHASEAIQHPNQLVLRVTKRYLKRGGKILEGGCGLGQNVFGLHKAGYQVIGVDNAVETVGIVQKVQPNLKIQVGDVAHLEFSDNEFDGYWSLGVIEHFWDGYQAILGEMRRVIKPGGFIFITFPAMNRSRLRRAERGCYPIWNDLSAGALVNRFYQFILPVEQVKLDLVNQGFIIVEERFQDAYKGAKDEYVLIRKICAAACKFGLGRMVQICLNIFARNQCGHIAMLVMKNGPKEQVKSK